METQMLAAIADIKALLLRMLGLADKTMENPYDEAALDKAAKEFLKLSAERGEWVTDEQISRYVKHVPYRPGAFLRKSFGFSNYYRRGHDYLYSKKDLIAFNAELEKRNINLVRYQELLNDQASFKKNIAAKGKDKPYQIPAGLKDIETSDIPAPDPELVRADIARHKKDFKDNGYAAYIDIYQRNHALLKKMYVYEKYLEKGLKRRCLKWCDDFNYANRALEMITGRKEQFVPPADPTQIEL